MVATSCFLRSSLHSLNVRLHTTITCMLKFRQLMQFSDCVWSSLGSEMEGKTTHSAIANDLCGWRTCEHCMASSSGHSTHALVPLSTEATAAPYAGASYSGGCFCNQPCTCHKATIVDQLPSSQCASPLHQSANSWPGDMSTLPGDPGPSHGRMSDSFNLALGWDATGELFQMNELVVKATVDTKSTLEKGGHHLTSSSNPKILSYSSV